MSKMLTDYFSLWTTSTNLGSSGTSRYRGLVLYVGVLLGAMSNVVYNFLNGNSELDLGSFTIATIASVVVFPYIYNQSGLNRGKISFVKWCIAFQNGFLFSLLMPVVSKLVEG